MKRKFRTIIDDDGNVEVYDESGNLIKTMKLSEADRARLLKAETLREDFIAYNSDVEARKKRVETAAKEENAIKQGS